MSKEKGERTHDILLLSSTIRPPPTIWPNSTVYLSRYRPALEVFLSRKKPRNGNWQYKVAAGVLEAPLKRTIE